MESRVQPAALAHISKLPNSQVGSGHSTLSPAEAGTPYPGGCSQIARTTWFLPAPARTTNAESTGKLCSFPGPACAIRRCRLWFRLADVSRQSWIAWHCGRLAISETREAVGIQNGGTHQILPRDC